LDFDFPAVRRGYQKLGTSHPATKISFPVWWSAAQRFRALVTDSFAAAQFPLIETAMVAIRIKLILVAGESESESESESEFLSEQFPHGIDSD
jgi:hypothetical protein